MPTIRSHLSISRTWSRSRTWISICWAFSTWCHRISRDRKRKCRTTLYIISNRGASSLPEHRGWSIRRRRGNRQLTSREILRSAPSSEELIRIHTCPPTASWSLIRKTWNKAQIRNIFCVVKLKRTQDSKFLGKLHKISPDSTTSKCAWWKMPRGTIRWRWRSRRPQQTSIATTRWRSCRTNRKRRRGRNVSNKNSRLQARR